jgi:hypothetical protein
MKRTKPSLFPSDRTRHMRVIKLFPQKRHRRTASRSSCTTQPRPVPRRCSLPASSGVLKPSMLRSGAPKPGINSPSPSCLCGDGAIGRKAFRVQPRQVRTIVVERINDVTEQRADAKRGWEKCPTRGQGVISIRRGKDVRRSEVANHLHH